MDAAAERTWTYLPRVLENVSYKCEQPNEVLIKTEHERLDSSRD